MKATVTYHLEEHEVAKYSEIAQNLALFRRQTPLTHKIKYSRFFTNVEQEVINSINWEAYLPTGYNQSIVKNIASFDRLLLFDKIGRFLIKLYAGDPVETFEITNN